MLREIAFAGLSKPDQRVLADWLAAMQHRGIETAIDFSRRDWGTADLEVIIGIFRTGQPLASWLLVRYRSQWAVATVADETISAVRATLEDALRLIAPPGAV